MQATVAANWRGAYDLLVTGDGALSDAAAQTHGLIEPNFVSLTGGGGITEAQLDAIRATPGVDVAAPLAFVGSLSSPSYGVLVGATEPGGATSEFFSEARAFDVRVAVTVDDGVSIQTVQDTTATLVTGQVAGAPTAGLVDDRAGLYTGASTSGDGAWSADLTMPAVPELTSGIVAVDPSAERELLGKGGAFLATLEQFDREQSSTDSPSALAALIDPTQHDFEHWTVANGYIDGPVVPVVVSTSAYASLTAEVTVTPVALSTGALDQMTDPQTGALSPALAAMVGTAQRGAPVTSEIDLTAGLTPFALPSLVVQLPGADAPPGGTALQSTPALVPSLVGRAERSAPTAAQLQDAPGGVEARLVAQPQGLAPLSSTASEQTYRQASIGSMSGQGTPLYAPVGAYTPGDLTGSAQSASYVPLGTFSSAQVQVAQAGPHRGATLAPSFSGRGAVLPSPGAVTSLTAARSLRGNASVDVVRVRVAGISGYSASAMEAIGDVAGRIADLGLDVRVVAGSSLTPVGVYLPDYNDDGDLGWTTQEWTSLGAAVHVEQARLGAAAALMLVTLVGVGVLAGVAQLAGGDRRRREADLLTSMGWRRSRVHRWFLAEDVPAAALVVLACAAAAVTARTALATVAAVMVATLYVIATVVGSSRLTRPAVPAGSWWRVTRSARTARQVGRQVARAHPRTSLLSAAAVAVLTADAVAFAAVLSTAQVTAGTTRLAALVDRQLLLPQALLAAGALAAGLVMLVAGLRAALVESTGQHRMLIAAGWDRVTLARAIRAQLVAALTSGTVLAVAAGVVVAVTLDRGLLGRLLVLAVIVPALTIVAAMAWATRHAHHLADGAPR